MTVPIPISDDKSPSIILYDPLQIHQYQLRKARLRNVLTPAELVTIGRLSISSNCAGL